MYFYRLSVRFKPRRFVGFLFFFGGYLWGSWDQTLLRRWRVYRSYQSVSIRSGYLWHRLIWSCWCGILLPFVEVLLSFRLVLSKLTFWRYYIEGKIWKAIYREILGSDIYIKINSNFNPTIFCLIYLSDFKWNITIFSWRNLPFLEFQSWAKSHFYSISWSPSAELKKIGQLSNADLSPTKLRKKSTNPFIDISEICINIVSNFCIIDMKFWELL